MKKAIIIIPAIIILLILVVLCSNRIINWLFTEQYNSNGISHFLVITIDKNQPREYIGKLDNYDLYIEGLNIDETNFRSVDAKNVSIKEALDNNLVSLEDMKKYAFGIKQNDEEEILQYDNYEIAIINNDCIIRPKSF